MRLARPDLETLIRAATLAPSPDNNQPWLFESRSDGELLLLHDRSRALPSDVNDMFSMIALGAALENLCLAAGKHGCHAVVQHPVDFAPDAERREVVAGIRFEEGGTVDALSAYIEQRITNRKPYSRQAVAVDTLRKMEMSIAEHGGLQLHWISDRPRIRKLALLVAAADRIRFEYQPFHTELYRQLRFTPEEAEATRDGLDVRCLELPPGGESVLHCLREWPRMRRLNRFGFSRLMSLASVVQVWRTGTMGLLTTRDDSPLGYLQAGRALQRIWLMATKLGLAFHPLGSLPIFLSRWKREAGRGLTSTHQTALEHSFHRFARIFPVATTQGLVLLFRLGYSSVIPARSLRQSPVKVMTETD